MMTDQARAEKGNVRTFIGRFLGARASISIVVAVLAASSLAGIDLLVMAVLQLLLKSVGVMDSSARAFGPFAHWAPSRATIALLLAAVGILRGVAQWTLALGGVTATEMLTMRLRRMCLYEMLQGRANQFVSAAIANFRINEVFPKAATFVYHGTFCAAYAAQAAVLLVLMMGTAPREALVALIGLAGIGLLVRRIDRMVHRVSLLLPSEQQKLIAGIERVARNWLLVKILGTDEQEFRSLRGNVTRYGREFIRANAFSQFGGALPITLGTALLMAIILLNLSYWHTPGLQFISFLYFFLRFIQSLGTLVATSGLVTAYRPYFIQARDYFFSQPVDETVAALEDRIYLRGESILPAAVSTSESRPPRIDVHDLSFQYDASPRELFHGLSFTVLPGTSFAIVGRSGAGKSTLLGLVLGLLHPDRGFVTIDGKPPRSYFAKGTSLVGYVGADPFIIEGTMKENLDYGRSREYTKADYDNALSAARLLDFVRLQPEGLNYRLSENGEGLSAGQKQRLALARALISQPRLLILDEASANLDVETEAEIAASIHRLRGSTTVLIASHRKGLIQNVDHAVDLSAVSADGPAASSSEPADLLQRQEY